MHKRAALFVYGYILICCVRIGNYYNILSVNGQRRENIGAHLNPNSLSHTCCGRESVLQRFITLCRACVNGSISSARKIAKDVSVHRAHAIATLANICEMMKMAM